jgi:hypothetical protein
MRIITYSDLHLEFGSGWMLPPDANGDVMILAGDIVTLRDYEPLDQILRKWKKPVLIEVHTRTRPFRIFN